MTRYGIVSADPDASAALADRLGRYLPQDEPEPMDDDDLTGRARRIARRERIAARSRHAQEDAGLARRNWGVTANGIDYAELDLSDLRSRIVVAHTGALLFSRTL